jgi:hypothetical protein
VYSAWGLFFFFFFCLLFMYSTNHTTFDKHLTRCDACVFLFLVSVVFLVVCRCASRGNTPQKLRPPPALSALSGATRRRLASRLAQAVSPARLPPTTARQSGESFFCARVFLPVFRLIFPQIGSTFLTFFRFTSFDLSLSLSSPSLPSLFFFVFF